MKRLQPYARWASLVVAAGCEAEPDRLPADPAVVDRSACDDAALRERLSYVELVEAGDLTVAPWGSTAWGLGAADLDRDGWIDVVVPHEAGLAVYGGAPDFGFVDRTEAWLPALPARAARGVAIADVDADGWLDLFVTVLQGPDLLLLGGPRGFRDATVGSGLRSGAKNNHGAFADFDGDGVLDLVVGAGDRDEGASGLYRGRGDGSFEDVTASVPEAAWRGLAWASVFVDLDADHRPDLYVANDGAPNRLLWNRADGWVEDDGTSGLTVRGSAMGIAIADLGEDGVPDLLVSDWQRYRMLESTTVAGLWVDAATARHLVTSPHTNHVLPWGVALEDLDNDGDLDLLASFSHASHDTDTYQRAIWQQQSYMEQHEGWFVERSLDRGLDFFGRARGFATADLDNDGWLDVIIKDVDGPPRVWRGLCGDASWLRVSLEDGTTANRDGVGAWVRVTVDGAVQSRLIRAGSETFSSSGPLVAHFGLGEADRAERVEVLWPDGGVTVVEDVEGGRPIEVSR